MSFISPINVNSQGINAASGFGAKPQAKEEATEKPEESKVKNTPTSVSADEVFNYMAQSAISITLATPSIDTSKYVDKESAARIAGFMSAFEDKVVEGLATFNKEFAGVDISDSAKLALVLAGINA